MSLKTTFYVPVRRCVKEYLTKEYGCDPILVVSNNLLGQLVMLATDHQPYRITLKRPANREAMLALRMPKRLQGRTMSDAQRENLTRVLEKFFREQMYTFIRAQSAVQGSDWGALRCFAAVYELDSECFDLDKEYKLWRDRRNGIINDNRLKIDGWYQSNRTHSDDQNEHTHAAVATI